jgi:hypothetical protein
VIFFNSALVHAATEKLEGRQISIGDSISFAFSRIINIILWTVIAATVGMVLGVLRSLTRDGGIGGLIGGFLVSLMGMAWSFATFFVVPVMVFENVGPLSAIKRSTGIVKKHWSEQILGGFAIGVYFILVYLVGVALIVGGMIVMPALFTVLVPLGLMVMFLGFIAQGAVQGVFLAELYRYSMTGRSAIFTDEIEGAMETKRI